MTSASQPKLQIATLHAAFESGDLSPEALLGQIYKRIKVMGLRPIWIELIPEGAALAALRKAQERKSAIR